MVAHSIVTHPHNVLHTFLSDTMYTDDHTSLEVQDLGVMHST